MFGRTRADNVIAVVITAVVAAGGLVACTSASSGGSATSGTIQVVGLASGVSGSQSPLALLVRDFEASNAGVKVKLTTLPFNQYAQVIRTQINAGSPPDVIQTTAGYGNSIAVNDLAAANALVDLSDQPWTKEIPAQFRDVFGTKGRTFDYAPTKSAIGMIYDKKSFAADGLTFPKTFAQVLTLCRQEATRGRSLLALGGQATVNLLFPGYALAASTAYAQNPQFPTQRLSGKTTFSGSPGWAQSLDEFNQMNHAKCFGDSPAGVSTDAANQALANGKALAVVSVLETLPVIESTATKGEWTVAPFPGGPDEASTRLPVGVSAGFAIPAKAKKSALAKKFIAFLADPANTARFAANSKSIPLITAGGSGPPSVPAGAQALVPYLTPAKSVAYLDQYWPSAQVEQTYMKDVQGMLTGQTSPANILKDMDQAWQSG